MSTRIPGPSNALPAPRPDGSRPRERGQDRTRRERRVLWAGLGLSLVLHLVALVVLGGLLRSEDRPASGPPQPVIVEPAPGLRVVGITEVEDEERASPEAEPTPPRSTPPPARTEVVEVPRTAQAAEPADQRTAADRLAPRLVDPRIWAPVVLIPTEATIEDVEARVAAALELLSDSALAETERQVRTTDWTVKDADGGRWGISPGKLHLGKITLPLPIAFPVHPVTQARTAEWHEFQLQADRMRLVESFEARVKAIRERRDRERSERRSVENGSGGSGGGQ